MGCCESRGDQIMKKYLNKHHKDKGKQSRYSKPIPKAHSKILENIPEYSFTPSEIHFNIRPLLEENDIEVWDRINFGDLIQDELDDWKIEHTQTDRKFSIKSKLTKFREISSHVIITEFEFGRIVPINQLIDLLNDGKKRMEWEKILCHIETLGKDYNDYIFFSRVEIALLYKRYFIERRLTRMYRDQVCIVFYSVDLPEEQIPESIKHGARRLNTILGIYFIRKCKNSTKLIMITMIEPLYNNLEVKFTVNGIKSWIKALEKQVRRVEDNLVV